MSIQHIRLIIERLRGIKRICNEIRGGIGVCPDCMKNEQLASEMLTAIR